MSRLIEPVRPQFVPAQVGETTRTLGACAGVLPIEVSAESENDIKQRVAAFVAEAERARSETRAWEARARESEHAREQIAQRMDAARREVYEANRRAVEAEARAVKAEAHAEEMEAARNALLSSTTWRATRPVRIMANCVPTRLRRMLAQCLKFASVRSPLAQRNHDGNAAPDPAEGHQPWSGAGRVGAEASAPSFDWQLSPASARPRDCEPFQARQPVYLDRA